MMAKSTKKPSKGSPTSRLQKWQRNSIFEAIEAVGLDPREFDLAGKRAEVRIKHKRSESYFIIGGNPGHYVGNYVVGDASAWPYKVYSWQAMIGRLSSWLEEVKRDLETPDLWAELQREAELLGAGSDEIAENTPFTPDEQKEIAGRLQERAEYVRRTYSLSEPQMRLLNAKLDYLVSAAGRLGRIDWRNAFAGAILSFILGATLPPESLRHIFWTLLRAVGHLYGLPELPSG
jgi:hypothetical protein